MLVNDTKCKYSVKIAPYDLLDHNIIVTEVTSKRYNNEINVNPVSTYVDFNILKAKLIEQNVFYNSNKSNEVNYENLIEKIKVATNSAKKPRILQKQKIKEMK